jgi:hypothetical protein
MAINRKYSDFLKESYYGNKKTLSGNLSKPRLDSLLSQESLSTGGSNSYSKLSELRDNFTDDVLVLSEFYRTSFSDLCKIDNKKSDLDKDYYQMQELLDKKGWDFESIKNLFSKEVNDIFNQDIFGVIRTSPLDSTNGYIDYYLYRTVDRLGLDKNRIHLGGDSWAISAIESPEELGIRYKYGYHHTEYGKLMLDQIGIDVEDFVKKVTGILVDMLNTDWADNVISNIIRGKYKNYSEFYKILHEDGYYKGPEDFKKYHILEDDRLIISIRDVVEDLNKLFIDINNGVEITNDDVKSELSELLYDFSNNIEYTGNEMIVYFEN